MIYDLQSGQHDLVSPDGKISRIESIDPSTAICEVIIENISDHFVGFFLPSDQVVFNFKSVLAQLGLNGIAREIVLDKKSLRAHAKVELTAIGALAREMLTLLKEGSYIGKLFAIDKRRLVRTSDYLVRMFGRKDRDGKTLLSFGEMTSGEALRLEEVQGHMVAFLPLRKGRMEYEASVFGFLPTLAKALTKQLPTREMIRLHQSWKEGSPRIVTKDRILLVATEPLHIRTVFARVVETLLPKGFRHTSANILQPNTEASGDIYELYGHSDEEIEMLPLEFYTLEPHREHVSFASRDQFRDALKSPETIFNVYKTAPKNKSLLSATFVVKGSQLARLKEEDWITADPPFFPFPQDLDADMQSDLVTKYITAQPSYAFLKAIESGMITSEGVLFTRYLPSPLMRRMLLSYYVQSNLKAIYFQTPSRTGGDYFSAEDRAMLHDLTTFGIPVFWADENSKSILQYVQRPGKTSGMFVPIDRVSTFRKATFFGIYGSNLLSGNFEFELKRLLRGILEMRKEVNHPLLHRETPLALVTGGGPGSMEVGNRMAKELEILSCAHVVDFRPFPGGFVEEQKQNPYIEAKMTYRLNQLIERQAEFYLDFPIFVMGGIGTDFEYSLEELRHKVAYDNFNPIILFGEPDYWRQKITSRFHCNLMTGTIKGSEWVSNSFFCIQTAEQGIKIYRDFFMNKLPIGRNHPPYLEDGFVIA